MSRFTAGPSLALALDALILMVLPNGSNAFTTTETAVHRHCGDVCACVHAHKLVVVDGKRRPSRDVADDAGTAGRGFRW